MKKILLVISMLLSISFAKAQDVVDDFNVGPYEVYYKGQGDVNYRLKKGVDLYEYFGLKRDTAIYVNEAQISPIKNAFQLNISVSIPRYVANGTSNVWGVDGGWKHKIGQGLYLNTGLSIAMAFGTYGESHKNYETWGSESYSETMYEIGVPLLLELCELYRKKASIYGSIGVVPTFYSSAKDSGGENKSGMFIAPKLEFGGYLPVGKRFIRLGGFAQYDINCSGGDYDIFKERIGRLFIGANIGLVF